MKEDDYKKIEAEIREALKDLEVIDEAMEKIEEILGTVLKDE